jgi:ABC-type multidrug transport system permease subunit
MRFRRFYAVLRARNLEFLRDRTSVYWNIFLPITIVIGFAFFFNLDGGDLLKVGIYGEQQASPALERLTETGHIQFIEIKDLEDAILQVKRHQLGMLIDTKEKRYWINEDSAQSKILEQLLESRHTEVALKKERVAGEEVRYVDWVAPGVFGMNIMFSSLFGVGYNIVRYRKHGVLRRLKATPLSAFEFLAAQVVSRLWLIVLITAAIYLGTHLLIGFQMNGSYLTLLLVLIMGIMSMVSVSLIIAARMSNQEAANGVLNLISLPMLFLSEVWFSLEGSPAYVQQLAQMLPLTHFTSAARAIMLDGAGLGDVTVHLAALLAMTIGFMAIAAYSFRWE